jgi:hypothetical protein
MDKFTLACMHASNILLCIVNACTHCTVYNCPILLFQIYARLYGIFFSEIDFTKSMY